MTHNTRQVQRRIATLRRIKSIGFLTEPELAVLRHYIASGTKTGHYDLANGVVGGLVMRGILFRPPSTVVPTAAGEGWVAFNISDWAWDAIRSNPSFVKAPPQSTEK